MNLFTTPHSLSIILLIFLLKNSFGLIKNACKRLEDYPLAFMKSDCYYNPAVLADTSTLIKLNGYPVEEHTVISNGYHITLYRIPPINNRKNKKPVLLIHGIFLSSTTWTMFGKDSLAFLLAEEGYDVWLGTYRGTTKSQKHDVFKIDSKKYWNFTIDDMVRYDYPKQLEFIVKKTEQKVTSIVYSLGGTIAVLYSAENPEKAAELVDGIIAMAPVLYFHHCKMCHTISHYRNQIKDIVENYLNMVGLFYTASSKTKMMTFCKLALPLCKRFLQGNYGDLQHFNPEFLMVILGHFPDGCSIGVLDHMHQLIETNTATHFDYNFQENIHKSNANLYNVTRMQTPAYFFYGKKDWIATEKDVKFLFNKLGSKKKKIQAIPVRGQYKFNHLDFTTSKGIKENLYVEIFKALDEMQKSKSSN